MALFELNSDITIGKFRFSGVNEVHIKRSIHSIVETALIKIPSIERIITNGKSSAETIITGKQFNDGDPVVIKLGYNGDLQTEFQGFVKRRNLNMPLEIECEGYSWLLRRNTIKEFNSKTSVKDLLNIAMTGLDDNYKISVQCDVDLDLGNVIINDCSGFDIINNISKYTDGCLSCFFIQPGVLWCGLIYTPYANASDVFDLGQANYKLGYNVIKDNRLQERVLTNDPVQVKYSKKLADGSIISETSTVFKNFVRTYSKVLNHITNAQALKYLVNEKAYRMNYSGYEGSLSAFLQPYASPGYKVFVTDDRYKERDGIYLIESTEIHFGMNGARRIVEIGPKVGFATE